MTYGEAHLLISCLGFIGTGCLFGMWKKTFWGACWFIATCAVVDGWVRLMVEHG